MASSSLLSVSMLASSAGVKLCTATAPVPAASAAVSAAGSRQSGGGVMPSMKARRLAAPMMNCMCNGSATSKASGLGSLQMRMQRQIWMEVDVVHMLMHMHSRGEASIHIHAHRLGGDQKGTPLEVVASGGKLWSNWAMRCVKYLVRVRVGVRVGVRARVRVRVRRLGLG